MPFKSARSKGGAMIYNNKSKIQLGLFLTFVFLFIGLPLALQAQTCPKTCTTPLALPGNISNVGHKFRAGNDFFFWMADTAWLFSTELVCSGDRCNSGGTFQGYVEDRRGQCFRALQGNLFTFPETGVDATNEGGNSPFCNGTDCTDVALENWDYNKPNEQYFLNVENRIERLNDQGMVGVIAPNWALAFNCCEPDNQNEECDGYPGPNDVSHAWTNFNQVKCFYDYISRKAGDDGNDSGHGCGTTGLGGSHSFDFTNKKIVWLVASNYHESKDVDNFAACSGAGSWDDLANIIRANDSDALVSVHISSGSTVDLIDLTGIYNPSYMQNQPCVDPRLINHSLDLWSGPAVNGEFNYEVTQACWDSKCTDWGTCEGK